MAGGKKTMAVPLDAIRAFHNAFRKDMTDIDAAAHAAANGTGSIDTVLKRYNFFNEVLVWHASGEEEFVFTAMENVAPMVAEAYERDHRGLDTLYNWLDKAVKVSAVEVARAASAFKFFMDFHLNKEEAHLYKIFNERVSLPDQAVIMGKMSSKVPQARFPEAIAWLFPLIKADDRENMIRIWQKALPQPVFTSVTGLIRKTIGDDWAEMTRRIPELG
jgi:hemerythrin-like domain-containing protein